MQIYKHFNKLFIDITVYFFLHMFNAFFVIWILLQVQNKLKSLIPTAVISSITQ